MLQCQRTILRSPLLDFRMSTCVAKASTQWAISLAVCARMCLGMPANSPVKREFPPITTEWCHKCVSLDQVFICNCHQKTSPSSFWSLISWVSNCTIQWIFTYGYASCPTKSKRCISKRLRQVLSVSSDPQSNHCSCFNPQTSFLFSSLKKP